MNDLSTASGRRLQRLCCGENGAPIQLSTDVLYFAHTPVGSLSAWLPLIVINDSDESLNIGSYSLDGDFEYDSSITSVSAGSSAVIKVRFKPTEDGLRLGTLQILTDAPGFSPYVKLIGVGGDEVTVSDISLLHARLDDAEGLIFTERSIRLTADTAMAQVISYIGAMTNDGSAFIFDMSKVFVGPTESFAERLETISSKLGENTALIESETSARTTANQATASKITLLTAKAGEAQASIGAEMTARAEGDAASAELIETLNVRVGATEASVLNETSARVDGDEAIIEVISLLGAHSADFSAFILDELTVRVSPEMSLAERFEEISATSGENAQALVSAETYARTTAQEALAGRITTIESSYYTVTQATQLFNYVNAKFAEEVLIRSGADGALSGRITTIEASYVTTTGANTIANNVATTIATAKVEDEATARANADLAISNRVTAVESTYITTTAAGTQATTIATTIATAKVGDEATARSNADLALGNRITTIEASYVTTTGANTIANTVATAKVADEATVRAAADLAISNRTSTLEATISDPNNGLGNAHARITTESTTRATAITTAIGTEVTNRNNAITGAIGAEVIARNSAIASEITRVETTVNGHTATIGIHATSIDGIFARYGVALDVDGHVIGFVQNNNGVTGTFDVVVDKFRVAMPGQAPRQVFSVTADGVQINGNLIVNGTVFSNQLGSGAMGEAAVKYEETNLAVNTQGTFTSVSSVVLTSAHGKPMMIDFTTFARCVNDSSTRIRLRVVRSDGIVIYGGALGSEIRVNDEGTPICIRAISESVVGITYTFTLQAVKSVNNETVNFGFRMALAQEMSRVNWQNVTVNSAPAGTDPGTGGYTGGTGGDGGGGSPPDPGGYTGRNLDGPIP